MNTATCRYMTAPLHPADLDRNVAYPSPDGAGTYSYGPCCPGGCCSWRFVALDGEVIGDHVNEGFIARDLAGAFGDEVPA